MKRKTPLILITVNDDSTHHVQSVTQLFADCILQSGGVPVYASVCPDSDTAKAVLSAADGVLFSGGGDIEPSFYGEEALPQCGAPSRQRDCTEKWLFQVAYAQDLPIFGICRGIQVMNVFAGGTLIQDIEAQIPGLHEGDHRQQPPYTAFHHGVTVLPGTPLSDILGGKKEISVNSSHHQAVKDLAPGFRSAAIASDGKITEAIVNPDRRFALGVQWHPEYLFQGSEDARLLFRAFVDACKGRES